jgi:hypothetical protein
MERATISKSRPGPARREGSVTGGTGRGNARRSACRMPGRAAGQHPPRWPVPGPCPHAGRAAGNRRGALVLAVRLLVSGHDHDAGGVRRPPAQLAWLGGGDRGRRGRGAPAAAAGSPGRMGSPRSAWMAHAGLAAVRARSAGAVLLSCRARLAPGQRRGASTDADAGAVSEDDMFFMVRPAPRPRTAWGVPSACKATRTGRRAVKGTVPCPG